MKLKSYIEKEKEKTVALRVPIFTNFNRELLAVDNFFDNFPKKTPIARALIYSIKVGGGGRRAFQTRFLNPNSETRNRDIFEIYEIVSAHFRAQSD